MLRNFLQSLQILNDEELTTFENLTTKRILKKGDFLIREGQVANELVFMQNGILRSFYSNGNGEDITYCFSFAPSFMTAFSSFISGALTTENIQALVDCEFLVIKKSDLNTLYNSGSKWLKVGKFFTELQYIELENRLFSFQRQKAKDRYEDLLKQHPDYIQQIPLQYLASYLGVTPRHLSRLRKEISL